MKFKIGGVPEHFNLPWKLAIEDGLFKNAGIEIHWTDMHGGTGQMLRGLENGSLDVAVLLTEGITRGILQGLNAQILQVYVTTPLHWGVHVPYHSSYQAQQDLENKAFAISRYGSGSHLMAYVMANQMNWATDNLKFKVEGDVFGCLWALENNEAQIFLWDKYTTHPYVLQKKCRYIDEVVTPWPCFVIAARKDLVTEYSTELSEICAIVNKSAQKMKNSENIEDIISWRYNLPGEQVQQWFKETEWNYSGAPFEADFEKTVAYLLKLDLISEKEAEDWQSKLFTLK